MPEEKVFDADLLEHPEFQLLNRTRRNSVIVLSGFTLVLFFFLMLMLSPLSDLAETPILPDSIINYGIIFNLGFVLACCLLATYYSWWSTNKLDPLRDRVKTIVQNENQEQ